MSRRWTGKITRIGNWLALALVLGAIGLAAFVYVRWLYRERICTKLIAEIAPEYGVDEFLVKAVVRQESNFDPFAYSSKGAIGLMQVMPGTGQEWALTTGQEDFVKDSLWTPRVNVKVGTWYLARSLAYWRAQGVDDPVPFALAEYNAGPGMAQRWRAATAAEFIKNISYPGVRRYIERVTGYCEDYKDRSPAVEIEPQ
ncbi:MAG: transglycosylase SLT domain-containing protein [Verrucomicrobiia bacterium]